MSIKIHYGYKLNQRSFASLNKFMNSVRAKISKEVFSLTQELLDLELTYWYDVYSLGLSQKKPSDAFLDIIEFGKKYIQFKICVFPSGKKILCMVFSSHQSFLEIWENIKGVTPYPYWNNYDPPQDVSVKAWARRGREWIRAIGKAGIPSLGGATYEMIGEVPFELNYEKYKIPDLDRRLKIIMKNNPSLVEDEIRVKLKTDLTWADLFKE